MITLSLYQYSYSMEHWPDTLEYITKTNVYKIGVTCVPNGSEFCTILVQQTLQWIQECQVKCSHAIQPLVWLLRLWDSSWEHKISINRGTLCIDFLSKAKHVSIFPVSRTLQVPTWIQKNVYYNINKDISVYIVYTTPWVHTKASYLLKYSIPSRTLSRSPLFHFQKL